MDQILLSLGIGVLVSNVSSNSIIPCTNQTSFCEELLGDGGYYDEDNLTCECKRYFYSNNSKCEVCPDVGESCDAVGCCGEFMVCKGNECSYCLDEYCWNMDGAERERLQMVAQVILAISLLLMATILSILFWNSCTRHTMAHRNADVQGRSQGYRMPSDSLQTLDSIHQRLVLMQLQDRPPPYNADQMSPWKNSCDITESPPSYLEALGLSMVTGGEDNPVFNISENITPDLRGVGFNNTSVHTNNVQTNCETVRNQAIICQTPVNILPTVPNLGEHIEQSQDLQAVERRSEMSSQNPIVDNILNRNGETHSMRPELYI